MTVGPAHAWAARLTQAPQSYIRAGISAAIRFHTRELDQLLTERARPSPAGTGRF